MSTLTSMCQKPKAVLYFVIQILKKKEMNATVKYWNQAAAISAVTLECLSLVFNLLPELIFFLGPSPGHRLCFSSIICSVLLAVNG